MTSRWPLKLALAVLVPPVTLELALHLWPALLPPSYLAGFPGNGTEFLHPGVLARTPVEGVLLPHLASAHHGPPPADLVELGVAPRSADADAREFPRVDLPADAQGFPNAQARTRCDLLIVGDSFGVAAAAVHPEGLQVALEKETGLAVSNVSLAGLGPAQERWVLETVGLDLHPRAVLWLYFSGNDLTASYEPWIARRDGHATWAEAWPERARPRLYLVDLVAAALRHAPPPRCLEPLPGFVLARSGQEVWFHPDTLRQMSWSRAVWEAYPTWGPVQTELRRARDACAAAGVRFLLVYLPSKPEILLPEVRPDPELARRTVVALGGPPLPDSSESAWQAMLAGRHSQEELLADFCAREAIPFLSATPALEAQAARGELGYLATDTHWQVRGQLAFLGPLLEFLRAQGLLP